MTKKNVLLFAPVVLLMACTNTENVVESKKPVLMRESDLSLKVENPVQSVYVGAPFKEILLKKTGVKSGKANFKMMNSNCKEFLVLNANKVKVTSGVPNKDKVCRAEIFAQIGARRSQIIPIVVTFLEYKGPSIAASNAIQEIPARGVISPIALAGTDAREGTLDYSLKETNCPGLLELSGDKVISKPRLDLSGKVCEALITVKSSAWEMPSWPLAVKIAVAAPDVPELRTDIEEAESQIFSDNSTKTFSLQTIPVDFGEVKFSVKETNCPDVFSIKEKTVIASAPTDFSPKLCRAKITGINASGETNPINIKVRVVNNNKDFLTYCRDEAAPEAIKETIRALKKHASQDSSDTSCEKINEKLEAAKELDLSELSLGSLKPLSKFTNLTNLQLSKVVSKNGLGRPLEDIADLATLTSLVSLDLSKNNIKNLSALSNLEKLQTLNLSENKISSLEDLRNLTLLEDLSLASQNGVSDLSPLSSMTKLVSLTISGNSKVTNLVPLAELKSLKKLQFEKCGVSDLRALKNFQNLTLLNASHNSISDVSPLSGLHSLQFLYLGFNQIKDISTLENLVSVEHLNLSANGLTSESLKYISGFGVLRSVDFSKNSLSTVDVFSKLESVESLVLAENVLTDLTPLKNLLRLMSVNLEKNPTVTQALCPTQSQSSGLNRECGFLFK